jgi:hypothetical protein
MRDPEDRVLMPAEIHVRDVRRLTADLRHLIEFRGYESLLLDFSATRLCFAEAMLPLIATIVRFREDGTRFRLILPQQDRTRRLLINCGWGQLIDPRLAETPLSALTHLPATRFRDATDQGRVVNSAIDRLLRAVDSLDRNNLKAFEWALNEITDNVLVHSRSSVGGFMQMSIHSNSGEVEFVVADAGIGIPKSMRSGIHGNLSDQEALSEAIKEGVTRNPDIGQGNGLYGSFQVCAVSGGVFHINSGNAFLVMSRDRAVLLRRDDKEFLGTSVVSIVNYRTPQLLERALRFQGRGHVPSDVLEKYEDDDALMFRIASEAASTGSRVAAFELRKKLQNMMKMSDLRLCIIDFTGTGILSSSFSDEFVAKLARNTGLDQFAARVKLRGLSEINREIVARSFRQRLTTDLPAQVLV